MKRYDTDVRNGTLMLETDDDWIEIGSFEDIYELVGGETYTIEYDERQRQMEWIHTDDEGNFTFDVREVLEDMDYNAEFVSEITDVDGDATDEEGYPMRTSVFADMMTDIWDGKGNIGGS